MAEVTQEDRDTLDAATAEWRMGESSVSLEIIAAYRQASYQRGKLEGARLAIEEVSSLTLMLSEKCACEIKQDAFRAWAGIIAALDPAKIVGEG